MKIHSRKFLLIAALLALIVAPVLSVSAQDIIAARRMRDRFILHSRFLQGRAARPPDSF